VELCEHFGLFKNTKEVQEALASGSWFSKKLFSNTAQGVFISLMANGNCLINESERMFTFVKLTL